MRRAAVIFQNLDFDSGAATAQKTLTMQKHVLPVILMCLATAPSVADDEPPLIIFALKNRSARPHRG